MDEHYAHYERRVEAILENIHELRELRYYGDYTASDILRDFDVAMSEADLTARQAECLRLVYEEDLTQAEAGIFLGIDRSTVSHATTVAIRKLSRKYKYWEEQDKQGDLTT